MHSEPLKSVLQFIVQKLQIADFFSHFETFRFFVRQQVSGTAQSAALGRFRVAGELVPVLDCLERVCKEAVAGRPEQPLSRAGVEMLIAWCGPTLEKVK